MSKSTDLSVVLNGLVGRALKDKGFVLYAVKQARNGDEFQVKYTVWCDADQIPDEGSRVDVIGYAGSQPNIYNDKAYANPSISKPVIRLAEFVQRTRQEVLADLDDMPF